MQVSPPINRLLVNQDRMQLYYTFEQAIYIIAKYTDGIGQIAHMRWRDAPYRFKNFVIPCNTALETGQIITQENGYKQTLLTVNRILRRGSPYPYRMW